MELSLFFLFFAPSLFFAPWSNVQSAGPNFDKSPPHDPFPSATWGHSQNDQLHPGEPLYGLSTQRRPGHRRPASASDVPMYDTFGPFSAPPPTTSWGGQPSGPQPLGIPYNREQSPSADSFAQSNGEGPFEHYENRANAPAQHGHYTNPSRTRAHNGGHVQDVNPANSRRTRKPSIAQNDEFILNELADQDHNESSFSAPAAAIRNTPEEIIRFDSINLNDSPPKQGPQIASVPSNSVSQCTDSSDGQRNFNGTTKEYPKVHIVAWTTLQLPIHAEYLKAGGEVNVKQIEPEATKEFDRIVEFMDDQGKWIEIEIAHKDGIVAKYLRDLFGKPPLKGETPKELFFGGKKRYFKENGTAESLYPSSPINEWTQLKLPVHHNELEPREKVNVKEIDPKTAEDFSKVIEYMDDNGEFIKIELKTKKGSEAKYLRNLYGNPPKIKEAPLEVFFGGEKQYFDQNAIWINEKTAENLRKVRPEKKNQGNKREQKKADQEQYQQTQPMPYSTGYSPYYPGAKAVYVQPYDHQQIHAQPMNNWPPVYQSQQFGHNHLAPFANQGPPAYVPNSQGPRHYASPPVYYPPAEPQRNYASFPAASPPAAGNMRYYPNPTHGQPSSQHSNEQQYWPRQNNPNHPPTQATYFAPRPTTNNRQPNNLNAAPMQYPAGSNGNNNTQSNTLAYRPAKVPIANHNGFSSQDQFGNQ